MDPLFDHLVDDAALFPPALETMEAALPAYRVAAPHPVLGRFLCPASRLDELSANLVPEDLVDLGIIADTGAEGLPAALDAARAEPRVRPSWIEIPLPQDADQARAAAVTIAALPSDLPGYIEIRRADGWREALDRIAAARENGAELGAKIRMGGAEVPPSYQVAHFIAACAERSLPFKCTAGLHHAIRDVDPGHHGFLNVMVATARAAQDPTANLVEALDSADGPALAEEIRRADPAAVRGLLVSYGSCDIVSPLEDLRGLGLIKAGDVGNDGSS
ncbi:hypothetical protein [Spirillospora sp. CA-294931]|uniref:hypothetical protein n=1 Tax=Spirillospora sp. CA-294931 TaxID=3240042 RepID=UPI003D8A1A4E